ncbi:MAG: AbrB/MazE/SpoVT family DNA-binding domain-containing protein [Planctomycetia bacterium]|jgi:AbrB family looped-hinge helix DNA binding protein
MKTITVSPKYQIVIPREIRDVMNVEPGQKLQIFQHGQRIELMPIRDIKEMRGFLKGANLHTEREEEDRL